MYIGFIPIPTSIPAKLIKRGSVTKKLLYSNPTASGVTEIAILELSSKSEIALHTHTSDYEIYYMIDENLAMICQITNAHSFENDTNELVRLLAIKSTTPFDNTH